MEVDVEPPPEHVRLLRRVARAQERRPTQRDDAIGVVACLLAGHTVIVRAGPGYGSRVRRALSLVSLAAWGWAASVALLDRRHRLSLDDVEPAAGGPRVSVVVPARNEARGIRAAIRSLAVQDYPELEVIVVDDESVDGTAGEALAAATDRVEVVAGAPLPEGWVGKSWACVQGARRATGEWLLFTDADIRHAPDTVGRAVALARREGRGVTLLPVLETGTAAERIVQPAAAVLIRSFVAPGPLVRSPRVPVAIAAGGFIFVSRASYDLVGGHAAIHDSFVEDAALAELLKGVGHPLVLASSGGRVRVRMYVGAREVWRGWRKNTSAGLARGSLGAAATVASVGALVSVWPLLGLAVGPRRLSGAAAVAQLFARLEVEPICPTPARYRLTLPIGSLVLALCSLASSLDRLRGTVAWRGRTYSSRSAT